MTGFYCIFQFPFLSLLYLLYLIKEIFVQSEDDFSLSGIAITALYFDGNSRILISGDQSGMVRCYFHWILQISQRNLYIFHLQFCFSRMI